MVARGVTVPTIRELRERAGLSQMRLAVLVGVSLGAVRLWESGKAEPKARHLLKLAEVLGVRPEEIEFGSHTQREEDR
jgi:transcriptional regulator with XRE-family HTH domain